ncbi:unnamed protein product [Rhizophagus irregularis]|uniref:Uncharacterized protein n=1 Tax=Rhizophagus irregularis TaxID=588596 RepID=A0A916EFR1_9GLOM|nr:unnamed protein product [Rhizophagus irregularis]
MIGDCLIIYKLYWHANLMLSLVLLDSVDELPEEKHDRTSEIKSCRTNITELLELRVSIIKDMTRILKLKAAG